MILYICVTDRDDGSTVEAIYKTRQAAERHPFAIDSATHRVEEWKLDTKGVGKQINQNILSELES